jgi:hypothetical protein
MHVAASNATKELQAKEKRIQHLERKVKPETLIFFNFWRHRLTTLCRCNNYAKNGQSKHANFPKPSNILVV